MKNCDFLTYQNRMILLVGTIKLSAITRIVHYDNICLHDTVEYPIFLPRASLSPLGRMLLNNLHNWVVLFDVSADGAHSTNYAARWGSGQNVCSNIEKKHRKTIFVHQNKMIFNVVSSLIVVLVRLILLLFSLTIWCLHDHQFVSILKYLLDGNLSRQL